MSLIVTTPAPPYYSVIFTSLLTPASQGYSEMAERMVLLAQQQDGFLGMESAREEVGITVSYWRDLAAIKAWKANSEHLLAQQLGREVWYQSFTLRIAKVERQYSM